MWCGFDLLGTWDGVLFVALLRKRVDEEGKAELFASLTGLSCTALVFQIFVFGVDCALKEVGCVSKQEVY